jgi:hypothetical protein
MDARRVYSAPSDRGNGVICDQTIALNGFYATKGYPEHLRRIRFHDDKLDKTLVFLTNNTALPALTLGGQSKPTGPGAVENRPVVGGQFQNRPVGLPSA